MNWGNWIENGGDSKWKALRQAVHIVMLSISKCDSLKDHMMLKGGILMALCYDSSRFTRDIDLSQKERYKQGDEDRLLSELGSAIQETVNEFDYGLDCRIQSYELRPRSEKNPTFPTLNVKVGYAYYYDKRSHQRLIGGNASTVIEIDFSFNETTKSAEEVSISEGHTLLRYSVIDLVAEKFRALLQQEERNRYRRQDIHDLYYLLKKIPTEIDAIKPQIYQALIASSLSKQLVINKKSMNESSIRDRTKYEYNQLKLEVADKDLVDFDEAYDAVMQFYESFPWNDN